MAREKGKKELLNEPILSHFLMRSVCNALQSTFSANLVEPNNQVFKVKPQYQNVLNHSRRGWPRNAQGRRNI